MKALGLLLSSTLFLCGCNGQVKETKREETTAATASGSCRGDLGEKRPVTRGLVVPNRGAFGVSLGMRRALVIECLGPAMEVSDYGVLSYGGKGIVDIYFKNHRVVFMNLAGPGFCLPHRICLSQSGALKKLRRYYKRTCESEATSGEPAVVLPGRLNDRRVQTAFYPSTRNTFDQLDIAYVNQSLALPCKS
jgi:hypothetical protein